MHTRVEEMHRGVQLVNPLFSDPGGSGEKPRAVVWIVRVWGARKRCSGPGGRVGDGRTV